MPISTSDSTGLKRRIAAKAREAGFDAVGFTRADARPDLPEKLSRWLELRRQGDMGWMEETAAVLR